MDLKGKVCIITGATSGIGKAAAFELARAGAILIIPARNMEKAQSVRREIIEQSGNSPIDIMECDLASFESIRSFAEDFRKRYDRLNILVNNAGVFEITRTETKDGIEQTFAVNHLSQFLLTNLLLDLMLRSTPARIIIVSSEAHQNAHLDLDDLESRNYYSATTAYAQSKLANILFTTYLADAMRERGITVNALHPGVIRTGLHKSTSIIAKSLGMFASSPKKGAETIMYLASSDDVENISGEYFIKNEIAQPSPEARNMEYARQLWEISMSYVKDYL